MARHFAKKSRKLSKKRGIRGSRKAKILSPVV